MIVDLLPNLLFLYTKTESPEEARIFKQAYQRWLLLHEYALIRYWDCGSSCSYIFPSEIFVIK